MAATAIIRMPDEGVHVRFGGTRMTFPGISNDTLTALPSDENADKWLRLSGNSGDCNGKTGYVWNDGELK